MLQPLNASLTLQPLNASLTLQPLNASLTLQPPTTSTEMLAQVQLLNGPDIISLRCGFIGADYGDFRIAQAQFAGALVANDPLELDSDHDGGAKLQTRT